MVAEGVTTVGLAMEIATQIYPGGLRSKFRVVSVVWCWWCGVCVCMEQCRLREEEDMCVLRFLRPAAYFIALAGTGTLCKSMAKGMGTPCFRIIQTHFSGGRGGAWRPSLLATCQLCTDRLSACCALPTPAFPLLRAWVQPLTMWAM